MRQHNKLSIYELVLLPMLGGIMFVSKLLMEFLPNIHLLGMFIMVFTIVYRWKALVPIYIYVFWWVYIVALLSGGMPIFIPGRFCGQ